MSFVLTVTCGQLHPPTVTHKCKFCDWRHEFKRHVALHEKTHSEWARPANQPAVHDQSLRSLMSSSKSADSNSSLVSSSPIRLTLAPGAKISKGRRGADVRIFYESSGHGDLS